MKITIRAARVNKGLLIPDAAKQIGISPRSLLSYEHMITQPTISVALKMAEVYGININDLIFFKK